MKMIYNPSTFDFFKHPDRIGETINIREKMFYVFEEVYVNLRKNPEISNKISQIASINEHPFFIKLDELIQNPKIPDEKAKCDEVFAFYIYKIARYVNPQFFMKILKFMVLFRECLNILYKERARGKSNEFNAEYSDMFNSEDAPDISNDFITEFLCTENSPFDFRREEAIDITHNFCQWLYDNNYTCSKLSLINNY